MHQTLYEGQRNKPSSTAATITGGSPLGNHERVSVFFLDRIEVTCKLTAHTNTHSTHHVDSDSKQAAGHGHSWAQHALESLLVFACCREPHAYTLFYTDHKRHSRRCH